MQATDFLTGEHREIERMLDCVEKLADRATVSGKLDWEAAAEIVEFFRLFADGCHHAKEEGHLFPMLAAKGLSRQYGRTGVMVCEHNQGRRHVRYMARAVAAASAGSPHALKLFLDHSRAYVHLLRRHILKEDHCLFPFVNRTFGEPEQEALLAAFEAADRAEGAAEGRERCLRLAERLGDRCVCPMPKEHE